MISARAVVAEGLATAFLLAAITGSGIMAQALAPENAALVLLCNALATAAMLTVLILVFGPISGAHLNPLVSLVAVIERRLPASTAVSYAAAQFAGAVLGVWAAHAMFDLPILQASTHVRAGSGMWFAEAVATFGLVLTILGCWARRPDAAPAAVGLYIGAAYWFTASTSFANPAVTVARALTDTFAGIAPHSVIGFILSQFAGAACATIAGSWLWAEEVRSDPRR